MYTLRPGIWHTGTYTLAKGSPVEDEQSKAENLTEFTRQRRAMGQVINLDEVYMDEYADLFNDQGWVHPGTGSAFRLEFTDRLIEVRRIAAEASEKGWLGKHPQLPVIAQEIRRETPPASFGGFNPYDELQEINAMGYSVLVPRWIAENIDEIDRIRRGQ